MKLEEKLKADFSARLLSWYKLNQRSLPWRLAGDPFKIWISEIMLQQTRVETVIPYYERFVQTFPDISHLAAAPLDKVLKLWEGLGYYARARNLHRGAKVIVAEMAGNFPATYEKLLSVPGIGPYTAAAVASIAFNEDRAVVDGNVERVLSRVLLIEDLPKGAEGKRKFALAAQQLLPLSRAGMFNQAMMELGAIICRPQRPECSRCPVQPLCRAYGELPDPAVLPAKTARKQKPHYDIAVGIVWHGQKILIDKRPENGLLGGLWELPGGKMEPGETLSQCVEREIAGKFNVQVKARQMFKKVNHAYTHFRITLHAFQCDYLRGQLAPEKAVEAKWVSPSDLKNYAFARSSKRIIEALLEG